MTMGPTIGGTLPCATKAKHLTFPKPRNARLSGIQASHTCAFGSKYLDQEETTQHGQELL